MEWSIGPAITLAIVAFAAFMLWVMRARRQPVVHLFVERWTERGWYIVRVQLWNRSAHAVRTVELCVTAPARARLLERSFIDRFAVAGRDGVRRPDPAVASRNVPLPMHARPTGSVKVAERFGVVTDESLVLEEVAADRDQREVLLYLPDGRQSRSAGLMMRYVSGQRPEQQRSLKLKLAVPSALRNKW